MRDTIFDTIWSRENAWRPDVGDYVARVSSDPGLHVVTGLIIQSFRFPEFSAREDAVADSILETYSWIFTSPSPGETTRCSFPDWLERRKDSIYWITGKPGAGKSTIMKHILQSPDLKMHLTKWAGQRPLLVTRYYAWNAGTTPQKSLLGLKQTLLYQALDQYPELTPIVCPRRWASSWLFNFEMTTIHLEDNYGWELEECFDNLMAVSATKIALAVFLDGLDEFDALPRDVVALVESLTVSSEDGIKVCAASRPWVEFNDAYSDAPKLQMDLCTGSDMEIFVTEKFRRCRAFRELSAAHPDESINLQQSLTHKANGVFVWLRIVVDTLESVATEGSGIVELREIAGVLPTDMCSLYDAIWNRTPERNRQRGAILIQAVESAGFPISWLFLWLLDEHARRGHDLSPDYLQSIENSWSDTTTHHVEVSLQRKLASKTRRILVAQSGSVDFTHRTAREWAIQPYVWDRLQTESGVTFNPNLLLLEAFTIQLASTSLFKHGSTSELWGAAIAPALRSASRIPNYPQENVDLMVRALDTLDERVPAAIGHCLRIESLSVVPLVVVLPSASPFRDHLPPPCGPV
jgi:hypothetical protein